MTRGAALQLRHALNLIFGRQLFPDFRLIRGGFPIHIEHLVARAQKRFRISRETCWQLKRERLGMTHYLRKIPRFRLKPQIYSGRTPNYLAAPQNPGSDLCKKHSGFGKRFQ